MNYYIFIEKVKHERFQRYVVRARSLDEALDAVGLTMDDICTKYVLNVALTDIGKKYA